jgi:septation ring formation regulator EzrA
MLKASTMSDQPDDLMLVMLRAIRGDIGEIKADMREVKERLGFLESQYASVSRRLDRVGGDIERINRRLGLADTHA